MKEQTQNKNRKSLLFVAIILALAAAVTIFLWIRSASYETTDDAQLNGNIFSIRAGVTAYLDSIYFADNQHVKKGDTLLVFDTKELSAKVQQARAALENAKATFSVSGVSALASIQHSKASQQTALSGEQSISAAKVKLSKAQNDFNRDQKLLKIDAITESQFGAAQASLAEAKANYESTVHMQKSAKISFQGYQSQAKAAQHQVSAAEALVNERKAELKLAEEALNHAYIIAPTDGIVTKRSVNQGQYVLTGQALCTVVNEDKLWVTANFKETQLKKIRLGESVIITVDAWPGLKLKGTVDSYGGATGSEFALIPPDNATGNFIKITQRLPVRIKINPVSRQKNKSAMLFPGMSVFVKVETK